MHRLLMIVLTTLKITTIPIVVVIMIIVIVMTVMILLSMRTMVATMIVGTMWLMRIGCCCYLLLTTGMFMVAMEMRMQAYWLGVSDAADGDACK